MSGSTLKYTETYHSVAYFYVDADVTVTGENTTDDSDEEDITVYKAFRLAFKEGWNAVYIKSVYEATESSGGSESTTTISLSISNPDLYWVLDD